MYDIIIQNGRVIDPSAEVDRIGDIYIRDGVFVQPEPGGYAEAVKVIDAKGCIVTPGLIDSHLHVFDGSSHNLNVNADIACIPSCVTTCVDAGSAGPLTFESFYHGNIGHAKTTIKAMLHGSFNGIMPKGYDEIEDPDSFDTYNIKRHFRRFSDCLVGLKVRQHEAAVRGFGIKPLEKILEIANEIEAEGLRCNVTVHVSDLPADVEMEDIVKRLRPGDVFTHMYQNRGKTILGDDGKVLKCLWEAKERGVIFDSGCATTLFAFKNMAPAFGEGFTPDIIGSDTVGHNIFKRPLFSYLNLLSMFLNLGMDLNEIIKAATWTPAQVYKITEEAGTLATGRPADVAIMKIWDQKQVYKDLYGDVIEGEKLIVPMATIKEGRMVFEQIFLETF